MKNILLFSFIFSIASTLTAQNVVFTETFNGGLPDNWTAIEVQGDGTQSANWTWTNFGPMGDFADPPLASTTANNGWMLFDSDLNCSTQNQEAWLVAPRQSASGSTAVFVRFETLYRSFNDRPTIEVSTDSMTWTSFEAFPAIEANEYGGGSVDENPQTVAVDISEVAAGQATYWIAFRFLSDGSTENGGNLTGCGYSWQVDDVEIVDGDPRADDDLSIDASFFGVAPNAFTPASQVEPLSFLADIINEGAQDQTNATFSIQIEETASETLVFTDELTVDFIGVDSVLADVLLAEQFTPPAETNLYEGTYAITTTNQDGNPENNQRSFIFGVTDTLYSKWANPPTVPIAPAGDNSYSYGNCYYIPNGDGFYGRYVSFAVVNPEELVGRSVNILTYQWQGDDNQDFLATPDEYGDGPLAFNTYTFDGTETGLITVAMSEEEFGIPLEDDAYYFTVIQYITDDEQPMFLFGSDEFNYFSTFLYTFAEGSPRYASILDVGNTGDFDVRGFGFDLVPVVDISISDNPDLISSTLPKLSQENKIVAYPTPADEFVSLQFDLVEAQDVSVRFMDIRGRLIQEQAYNNVKTNTFTYPLEQFAAGTYFIYVQAEEGTRTLKITVTE